MVISNFFLFFKLKLDLIGSGDKLWSLSMFKSQKKIEFEFLIKEFAYLKEKNAFKKYSFTLLCFYEYKVF